MSIATMSPRTVGSSRVERATRPDVPLRTPSAPSVTTPDPTSRRPATHPRSTPRRTARPAPDAAGRTRRPAGRTDRPADLTAAGVGAGGTRCAQPVGHRGGRTPISGIHARRRATAVGVLVGVALAVTVWVIGIVGNNYADSVTPQPVSTQVVHVRAGDSLSSIAARVAPDMPRQTVIDEIVELNDMPSSGLRVGQPLLTPAYR